MPIGFYPFTLPLRRLSSTIKRSSFDLVIVGGGLTGFCLAAATTNSDILRHKHVLLIESSPQITYKMSETYELRTVALNTASQKLLQELGAWDFIKSKRLQPVNKMKIWESQSDSFLTFERRPLAHIVENNLVTEALRLAAEQRSPTHLTLAYNTRVSAIRIPPKDLPEQLINVDVQFANNPAVQTLETALLVGADGPSSKVREAAGIKTVSWDHGQSAVVASLCMGEGHEDFTAWQRFTPTGPVALLPLSAKHCCLTWSTTNAEADRLMALSEEQFIKELNYTLTRPTKPTPIPVELLAQFGQSFVRALDSICGQCEPVSENLPRAPYVESLQPYTNRARFPLGFKHANFYHAPRVALVGDAAHRILPLAGQGANLGFGDVLSLIRCLEEAVSNGADIGSAEYLSTYTTDRQRAVVPVATVMEALNLLYSSDALTSKLCKVPGYLGATDRFPILHLITQLLTCIRAAGMRSVQSSMLIKNFLVEAAVTGQLGVPKSCI